MIKQWFRLKTSIGEEILIDEDELIEALKIWGTGEIRQFKQGFIRGDLIGAILLCTDRAEEIRDYQQRLDKWNRTSLSWKKAHPEERAPSEPGALKDIFEKFNFREMLKRDVRNNLLKN